MEDDEELKKLGKKAVKDGARKISKHIAKLISMLIKKFISALMKVFGKYILIILLAALIVGLVWAAIINANKAKVRNSTNKSIAQAIGEEFDEESNVDYSFIDVAVIEGNDKDGYYVKVSKDILDNIIQNLEEEDIEPKDLGLESYDCFRDFIEAEIKTQFPDLGNYKSPPNSEDIVTNGCIKIKRAIVNDQNEKIITELKYTTKDNFDSMCENNSDEALKYFTLDEKYKLIVAGDSYNKVSVTASGDTSFVIDIPENKEEKTITAQSPIDYRPVVNKYGMPFMFLIDVLQTTGVEGDELALGIASLVKDTEMEITIEVSVQENHQEESYEYSQKEDGFKIFDYKIREVRLVNSNPYTVIRENDTASIAASTKEKTCKLKIVTDTKYNTYNIELTKVNSWIANASKSYEVSADNKTTSVGPTTKAWDEVKGKADPTEYDINTDEDVKKFMNDKIAYWKDVIGKEDMPAGCKIISLNGVKEKLDVSKLEITLNCTQTTSSTSTTKKFDVTPAEITSNEENIFKVFDNNREAISKLQDSQEALYASLEENTNTANFADIMRYLINKYTDPNYKGTLNLDSFNLNDFQSPSDILYGGTIQEKVWFALRDLGYSEEAVAGAMGNIHYESGSFDPNAIEGGYTESTGGIGICQWTNNGRGTTGRNAQLRAYAQSKGKDWRDEDTQVEFLIGEIARQGSAVDYTNFQLLDRRTYYNNNLAYEDGWKNSTTTDDATIAFCYSFERPNVIAAQKSMRVRQGYALDYYNQFHGKTRGGGRYDVGSGIIAGTFTSGVTGKIFKIYQQMWINDNMKPSGNGWSGYCNKGVAITIVSGYTNKSDKDLIDEVNKVSVLATPNDTPGYFSPYNLNSEQVKPPNNVTEFKESVRTNISAGKYIAFHMKGNCVGKSGNTWTNYMHWVSILGYKVEDGQEMMFIADPGSRSRTGWYPLDEFENVRLNMWYNISEK